MTPLRVECLRCGDVRVLHRESHHRLDGGECPRCRYVGWAESVELDERVRALLRRRPPALRRVRLVV